MKCSKGREERADIVVAKAEKKAVCAEKRHTEYDSVGSLKSCRLRNERCLQYQ